MKISICDKCVEKCKATHSREKCLFYKENTMESKESRGTLKPTEPHPAAESAKEYIATLGLQELMMWQESFASCAIENNRLAEICCETLDRLLKGQPVSDRYLLGLAWTISRRDSNNTNNTDAEKDYKDMRKFQALYIQADQELRALKKSKDFCDVCWTSSWMPVPADYPNAQRVGDTDNWVLCQMCEADRRLRALLGVKEKIKEIKLCQYYPDANDTNHGGVCYCGSELSGKPCTEEDEKKCQWVKEKK